MNRKYRIIVNFDCMQYIENIFADNIGRARNVAWRTAVMLTNGGNTGWLQSYCAKKGWIGDSLGVVHDPRDKEEPDYPISEKGLQVLNLVEQGVSQESAEFIVYGPSNEYDECPDLEADEE